MDWLHAILLGIVQGLTEFLPVSSSAHIRLFGLVFMDGRDPGATFTAITQIGTELAVLIYFWPMIVRIIRKWFKQWGPSVEKGDADVRMGWFVILATIPIGAAGYLFQDLIRGSLRSLWFTAFTLIFFGILLWIADRWGRKERTMENLRPIDAIWIGLAQMLALVPGVSRSGATTTMARGLGYTRTASSEFAFLIAVPAVFGAGFYELLQAIQNPGAEVFSMGQTAVATLVAFVIALVTIRQFMAWVRRHSFTPFVVWRLVLGVIIIIALSAGVIEPLAGS
ncbi:undecaprenyl-diphosphatase UppP [Agrococcus casei]|uniref:Undecaprenyl-diphosphatase n=1 Tax=Agrococcus casei LMG 22410 TaxID=1255656 RepID=A0A1R4FSN2_9MICO|nr:undecaprenyl-diphosphatase UppP [Agrococcus casei]SJM58851.1 Undecaprenyl-diphosphatase [Agrococcus casei LMG 22410]